jgi:hypothetical protein
MQILLTRPAPAQVMIGYATSTTQGPREQKNEPYFGFRHRDASGFARPVPLVYATAPKALKRAAAAMPEV